MHHLLLLLSGFSFSPLLLLDSLSFLLLLLQSLGELLLLLEVFLGDFEEDGNTVAQVVEVLEHGVGFPDGLQVVVLLLVQVAEEGRVLEGDDAFLEDEVDGFEHGGGALGLGERPVLWHSACQEVVNIRLQFLVVIVFLEFFKDIIEFCVF